MNQCNIVCVLSPRETLVSHWVAWCNIALSTNSGYQQRAGPKTIQLSLKLRVFTKPWILSITAVKQYCILWWRVVVVVIVVVHRKSSSNQTVQEMDRSAIETPFASLGGAFQNMSGQKAFQSPFLQVDPSIIGSPNQIASEFIFPDGGSKPSRGRFELAFSQIGGTILVGGGIGGALGALRGLWLKWWFCFECQLICFVCTQVSERLSKWQTSHWRWREPTCSIWSHETAPQWPTHLEPYLCFTQPSAWVWVLFRTRMMIWIRHWLQPRLVSFTVVWVRVKSLRIWQVNFTVFGDWKLQRFPFFPPQVLHSTKCAWSVPVLASPLACSPPPLSWLWWIPTSIGDNWISITETHDNPP